MDKIKAINKEVKNFYKKSSNECMRMWFYENHVLVVKKYSEEISRKTGANTEITVLAALLHDIARSWNVWDDPDLMKESLKKAEEIMKKHKYSSKNIEAVKKAIILHGCHDKLPDTKEGKVIATADAMAHL